MTQERWKIVALAACVAAAGVAGAWPFRRTEPLRDRAPATLEKPDMVLRKASPGATARSEATEPPSRPTVETAIFAEPAPPALTMNATHDGVFATSPPPALAPAYKPLIAPATPPILEASPTLSAPPALEAPPPTDSAEPDATVVDAFQPRRPTLDGWRRHRIADGDTLERLSRRYLGDPTRETEIFQANRHVLQNPEILPVGRWLRIPPQEQH